VTDVIAVHGNKLAPRPLEEAMQTALGVETVCLLTDPASERANAVHAVIETATPIDASQLHAAAKAALPMVAQVHFHFRPTLPRNNLDKVDRVQLRQQLIRDAAGVASGN
jgi:acyl-coenzyme A synthetase/AMP-(fatty) acid ligase